MVTFRVDFKESSNFFDVGFQNVNRVFEADFQNVITTRIIPDPYMGSYEVTPELFEQTMYTRNKTMAEDVTIHEVPVYRTRNPQGGNTIIIARSIDD